MKMFYLIYHGTPNKYNSDQTVGGAYIGCWIESTSLPKADRIARKWIKRENWDIIEVDEQNEIDASEMTKKSPGFKYYEQALIDKEVFVFHTYPKSKRKTSTSRNRSGGTSS